MKQGDVVSGWVAKLNGDNLNIAGNLVAPGDISKVKHGDVEKTESSKTSPMPEDLLTTLNREEVLDRVAYIMSRGDAKNRMFR